MTGINLYQDSTQSGPSKKEGIVNGGFIVSLSLLFITLVVWGALKLYSGILERQNTALINQIQQEKKSITGNSELDRVTDFQKRVEEISQTEAAKKYVKEVVGKVAAGMVAGSVLTSFSDEDGRVILAIRTDGFQTVARQILSFKKSGNFDNVSVDSINRGEKDIVLNLKMTAN